MKQNFKKTIARKISSFSPYFEQLVQIEPLERDDGFFLSLIDNQKKISSYITQLKLTGSYNLLFINGNFNYHDDIQSFLNQLHSQVTRTDRVCIISYSPYLELIYRLLDQIGLFKGRIPTTFLTFADLKNLARLSKFSVVKHEFSGLFPFYLFGAGDILNGILNMIPFVKYLSPLSFTVLRPIKPSVEMPSLSVIIPARNEAGNIENAITRMPHFPGRLEIIYVEGNSTDNTVSEIERVIKEYSGKYDIRFLTQSGKGKGNAVEKGFAESTGDLITILDADLTMPPEMLPRFYQAFIDGDADFINGSRLLYPMENNAMRFLNKLGNVFFSKALSFVLSRTYTDTLCGTKLFLRSDWYRFLQWRETFGKHDPFGDFDMIFPSSILCLDTVDIPIKYRDRVYGTTNIQRFRHGFMLLKMTLVGLTKIKLK